MYSAAASMPGMSSGIFRRPPAAFSCPPPLKNSLAHPLADVPFFERIETLIFPSSSLTNMLILTSAMERGMLTKPSVSPSSTEYSFWVFLSITMYATPSSVIVRRSFKICPISRILFSPYWLYMCRSILSRSTPAPSSEDAIRSVEGYVEFPKLLVSVVIPVISAVADSAGSLSASCEIMLVCLSSWYRSSDAEDISVSENARSNAELSGLR